MNQDIAQLMIYQEIGYKLLQESIDRGFNESLTLSLWLLLQAFACVVTELDAVAFHLGKHHSFFLIPSGPYRMGKSSRDGGFSIATFDCKRKIV